MGGRGGGGGGEEDEVREASLKGRQGDDAGALAII